jgi:predicted RND superfamily exporter protein
MKFPTTSSPGRLLDAWAALVQGRPWYVIIAALIFIAITVPGLRFVTINGDYRLYFKSNNPDLLAWEDILNTYSPRPCGICRMSPGWTPSPTFRT